jgi:hypothetical protein
LSIGRKLARRNWLFVVLSAVAEMLSLLSSSSAVGAAQATTKVQASSATEAAGHEPITVSELPVPPTASSRVAGSCAAPTGCISSVSSGGFLPDNIDVVASFSYAGAPSAPDPRSIYSGSQLALIRTNGTKFPDGESWLCITCGMPATNRSGGAAGGFGYPQPFSDGERILTGGGVLDCSPYPIDSPKCTPNNLHSYPIDGGGGGKKLDPDQVHVGWNAVLIGPGGYNEYAFFGRLKFDPKPTTGTPLSPRYDLTDVSMLYNPKTTGTGNIKVNPKKPNQLEFNPQVPGAEVGEFKGFDGNGKSVIGVGVVRSADLDHFATSLATGRSVRLDADPAYSDPDTSSPDGKWTLEMDVRYRNRFLFMAGLPGVPPILDQAGLTGMIAGYNIGSRRLFQPYLTEDSSVGKDNYQGQQVNACTTGPCSTLGTGPDSTANSPLWGSMADSAWSPNGTKVVYWQAYAAPGTCGPPYDTVACPQPSTEPGGRSSRIMLAVLTSRKPERNPVIKPVSNKVPWGIPFPPGTAVPTRSFLPSGTYTLRGRRGSATVHVVDDQSNTSLLSSISVSYANYSDDGVNFINGTQSTSLTGSTNPLDTVQTFHEALRVSGANTGTEVTSEPDGYTIAPTASLVRGTYEPTGTIRTTLDGKVYDQPPPYPSS